MKCNNCTYEGEPEFGQFEDKELVSVVHIRCPRCRSTRHITLDPVERIEMALRYPEYCYGPEQPHSRVRKVVDLTSVKGGEAAYSIHCPYCSYGEGGGFLPKDQVEHLKQVMLEVEA